MQKIAVVGVIKQLEPFRHELLSEYYREDAYFGDFF
jgi:hypothetical protein